MSTVYVVGSASMGSGSAELGGKILGNFFRTVPTVEPLPEAIVFYNGGVRLLTPSSPHLAALRALDEHGVELLACVTCLESFGLLDDLAVGRKSNMREIVQHMTQAAKVITL